jgi:hypothetical protein
MGLKCEKCGNDLSIVNSEVICKYCGFKMTVEELADKIFGKKKEEEEDGINNIP